LAGIKGYFRPFSRGWKRVIINNGEEGNEYGNDYIGNCSPHHCTSSSLDMVYQYCWNNKMAKRKS
jgi:hypothetical protein